MHENKTLIPEKQDEVSEKETGWGSMKGNSVDAETTFLLRNWKSNSLLNEYQNILALTDTELIDKLIKLYNFKVQVLDKGYYNGIEGIGYFNLKAIQFRFDEVFVNDPVTIEDVNNFNSRVSEKGEEKFIEDLHSYYKQDGKILISFLKEGPSIIDTLKNDGQAYINRVKTYEEMTTQANEIALVNNNDFSNIQKRAITKDTTQSDIDKVRNTSEIIKLFIANYEQTSDTVIKEVFKQNYEASLLILPNYEQYLIKSPDYLKSADKKRAGLGDNPSISLEGGSYIEKGEKEGKEDKANISMHKFWGTYSKKQDTYSIFKKDKNDTNEIEMNDVVQGVLGDCYLISSIASVARKNPEHIRNLIAYTPGDSFANVTLNILNPNTMIREPKQIKVDFYFPVNDLEPSYAKIGDNELWVMLIEKAYAKVMGGYDNIIGGSPGEALAVLTGNEAVYSETKSEDIKDQLKKSVSVNMAAVGGTKNKEEINALGKREYQAVLKEGTTSTYIVKLPKGREIVCNHAYSILEYSETEENINIRNPHGGENSEFTVSLEEFINCFSGIYYSEIKE